MRGATNLWMLVDECIAVARQGVDAAATPSYTFSKPASSLLNLALYLNTSYCVGFELTTGVFVNERCQPS